MTAVAKSGIPVPDGLPPGVLAQVKSRVRAAAPARAGRATQQASVVRAAYGIALLGLPGPMIAALTGAPASGRTLAVARILGVRQLAQAAVCGLLPTRFVIQAGAVTDGLHAASMLALAGHDAGLRRALLADASAAATLAGWSVAALRP